jgi:hypothetical protein
MRASSLGKTEVTTQPVGFLGYLVANAAKHRMKTTRLELYKHN